MLQAMLIMFFIAHLWLLIISNTSCAEVEEVSGDGFPSPNACLNRSICQYPCPTSHHYHHHYDDDHHHHHHQQDTHRMVHHILLLKVIAHRAVVRAAINHLQILMENDASQSMFSS
ncbi:hypothetical protein NE237_031433 [Protea cynaroides]|uniref:Uncharacterized protein n=1 Tax=Protea cynaroides TaxID=273540 RepID=A0A9Q0L243_9MAGN|nr:hypothetical protein NE237_031433 [Protea cynaroides]